MEEIRLKTKGIKIAEVATLFPRDRFLIQGFTIPSSLYSSTMVDYGVKDGTVV